MVRMILSAALLSLAILGVTAESRACEGCARFFAQRTVEGKLVSSVLEVRQPEAGLHDMMLRVRTRWLLKTPDKTYILSFGSGKFINKHLSGLANILDGRDVTVTGRIDGDTIEVRELEAKEETFNGVLE